MFFRNEKHAIKGAIGFEELIQLLVALLLLNVMGSFIFEEGLFAVLRDIAFNFRSYI